jgi:hypothetical protein
MKLRTLIPACLLAMGTLVSTATAGIIQMTFSGSINSSNMTAFPVNQLMTATFTYESTGSYQFVANNQAFYVDHLLSLSLDSGGYHTSYTVQFGQINKYDNLSNFDGISFQAATNPATYQYTNPRPQAIQLASVLSNNVTQAFDNIIINLGSNSNSVWSDYLLPVTYNFASFDQTKNMLFGFSGGSFSVGNTTLLVSDLTNSPEPGTMGLFVLAGVAATLLRKRA